MPTIPLRFHGTVENRGEASTFLSHAGDAVVVHRGTDRLFVMLCPCGCGETLPVNLDSRVGPAWRFYRSDKGVSIYPSVWRDTGCQSHFILWRDEIYLFGGRSEETAWSYRYRASDPLQDRVLEHIDRDEFRSHVAIADELGLVPWETLSACRSLVRKGLIVEGQGKMRGTYRRT